MAGMLPTLSKEAIHRETSACGLRNGISTFMCDVKIATHVHRDNRDMHLCLKGVVHSLSPTWFPEPPHNMGQLGQPKNGFIIQGKIPILHGHSLCPLQAFPRLAEKQKHYCTQFLSHVIHVIMAVASASKASKKLSNAWVRDQRRESLWEFWSFWSLKWNHSRPTCSCQRFLLRAILPQQGETVKPRIKVYQGNTAEPLMPLSVWTTVWRRLFPSFSSWSFRFFSSISRFSFQVHTQGPAGTYFCSVRTAEALFHTATLLHYIVGRLMFKDFSVGVTNYRLKQSRIRICWIGVKGSDFADPSAHHASTQIPSAMLWISNNHQTCGQCGPKTCALNEMNVSKMFQNVSEIEEIEEIVMNILKLECLSPNLSKFVSKFVQIILGPPSPPAASAVRPLAWSLAAPVPWGTACLGNRTSQHRAATSHRQTSDHLRIQIKAFRSFRSKSSVLSQSDRLLALSLNDLATTGWVMRTTGRLASWSFLNSWLLCSTSSAFRVHADLISLQQVTQGNQEA